MRGPTHLHASRAPCTKTTSPPPPLWTSISLELCVCSYFSILFKAKPCATTSLILRCKKSCREVDGGVCVWRALTSGRDSRRRRDRALICPEPRETERTRNMSACMLRVTADSREGRAADERLFSAARARLCLECKHVRKVWESLCVHAGDRFLCFGSQGNNSWWWARSTSAGLRACRWLRMGVWTGGVKKENCERKLGGGEGDTGAVFFSKVKLCWWTNGFSNKHLSKLTPPFSIRPGGKTRRRWGTFTPRSREKWAGMNWQTDSLKATPTDKTSLCRGPLYIKPIKTSITLTIYNYRTT